MIQKVIAKASGGEPLCRMLVELGDRVLYLANPERLDAVLAGESYPIGFPEEDVFEFEERVFAILTEQWARQQETDPAIWRTLRRYSASTAIE